MEHKIFLVLTLELTRTAESLSCLLGQLQARWMQNHPMWARFKT